MSQLMAEQVVTVVAPSRAALRADEPAVAAADSIPFGSEDDLDWAENQIRSPRDITRLDAAFIGLAITVTAAVVAVVIGLLSAF